MIEKQMQNAQKEALKQQTADASDAIEKPPEEEEKGQTTDGPIL